MSEGDISIIRNKHSSFCHGDYGRSIGYETKYDPVPNGVLPKSGNTWRHIWAFWYLTGIPNQNRSLTTCDQPALAQPPSASCSLCQDHQKCLWRIRQRRIGRWQSRSIHGAEMLALHLVYLGTLLHYLSIWYYIIIFICQVLDRWQGFQTYLTRQQANFTDGSV